MTAPSCPFHFYIEPIEGRLANGAAFVCTIGRKDVVARAAGMCYNTLSGHSGCRGEGGRFAVRHRALIAARRLGCLLLALLLAVAGASGEELLRGGDFSRDLAWQLYTESGGAAKLSVADGEMAVDVSAVGSVAHAVQPYCDGFGLKQGVTYRLRYDVRASVPRDLYVRIQRNGGDYRAYFEELIHVTEKTQHREAVFTMKDATDPAPRLCVNMGYTDAMRAAASIPARWPGTG